MKLHLCGGTTLDHPHPAALAGNDLAVVVAGGRQRRCSLGRPLRLPGPLDAVRYGLNAAGDAAVVEQDVGDRSRRFPRDILQRGGGGEDLGNGVESRFRREAATLYDQGARGGQRKLPIKSLLTSIGLEA